MEDKWFLDSCCTRHLINKREHLMDHPKLNSSDKINVACQDVNMNVIGIGNVKVKQIIHGKEMVTLVKHVAYVPRCRTNLVSLSKT